MKRYHYTYARHQATQYTSAGVATVLEPSAGYFNGTVSASSLKVAIKKAVEQAEWHLKQQLKGSRYDAITVTISKER